METAVTRASVCGSGIITLWNVNKPGIYHFVDFPPFKIIHFATFVIYTVYVCSLMAVWGPKPQNALHASQYQNGLFYISCLLLLQWWRVLSDAVTGNRQDFAVTMKSAQELPPLQSLDFRSYCLSVKVLYHRNALTCSRTVLFSHSYNL